MKRIFSCSLTTYCCNPVRLYSHIMSPPHWTVRGGTLGIYTHTHTRTLTQDETVVFGRGLLLSETKFLYACINKRLSASFSHNCTHTHMHAHTLLPEEGHVWLHWSYYDEDILLKRVYTKVHSWHDWSEQTENVMCVLRKEFEIFNTHLFWFGQCD